MSKKFTAIAHSVLYLLLFVFCIVIAAIIFGLAGLPGLAAPGAAFLGVAALFLIERKRNRDIRESFSLKPLKTKDIILIAGLSVPITLLVQSVQFIVPQIYVNEAPQFNMSYGVLSLFTTVIVSPVAEEVFFRGFIFKKLTESFHPAAAVLISSLFFSGLHSGELWTLMAMLISIFYAILLLKYKSIYAPVTAHLISNFIAVFYNMFLSVS